MLLERKTEMYYNFKQYKDYDANKILKEMSSLIANKDDLPPHSKYVSRMIHCMLPRKLEEIYLKIDNKNVAKYLVDFIAKDPVSEIKRKARLDDPVSNFTSNKVFLLTNPQE